MKLEFTDNKLGAIFGYTDYLQEDERHFSIQKGVIKILWNRNEEEVLIFIDNLEIRLLPNQLVTVTYFQNVHFPDNSLPLTAYLFNREFYCIIDHDSEVSCNGILFFGTQDIPIVSIPIEQHRKFHLLEQVIIEEFRTSDNIQGDMLVMLLKRLIILTTRLAKAQLIVKTLDDNQIDIIRQFNVLVDMHFRERKKVKEYAELLHKSPKTLSNLFATYNQKSPLQIIQDRIVLEAKRLILFSDKQTQEIAYELGFEDPAYFSRYFKKVAGVSPSQFKETPVLI